MVERKTGSTMACGSSRAPAVGTRAGQGNLGLRARSRVELYRESAARLREQAAEAPDQNIRTELLQMARGYDMLAKAARIRELRGIISNDR